MVVTSLKQIYLLESSTYHIPQDFPFGTIFIFHKLCFQEIWRAGIFTFPYSITLRHGIQYLLNKLFQVPCTII